LHRLAVELLAEKGAHVDVRDAWMRTPMHFAASFGWGERFPCVVTSLYFAGANCQFHAFISKYTHTNHV
jgi:hypothetical protein